jgi:hypothetical protein
MPSFDQSDQRAGSPAGRYHRSRCKRRWGVAECRKELCKVKNFGQIAEIEGNTGEQLQLEPYRSSVEWPVPLQAPFAVPSCTGNGTAVLSVVKNDSFCRMCRSLQRMCNLCLL